LLTDRVTRYLLDRGAVTPAQVDEARRTQSFFGGALETHLLKLGFVDEETLGDALTETYGVPYASGERLRFVPPEVLAAVPPEIARRHRVCPFRLEDRRLRVAMLNPRDARALAELQATAGLRIEPWITSEFRLVQALERHYRLPIEGVRSITLAPPAPLRSSRRPPERETAAPVSKEAEPEIGLDGRPLDAEIGFDDSVYFSPAQAPAGPPAPEDRPSPSAPATPEAPVPPPPPAAADPLERLEAALATAADRDELADALLSYCASRSARCALFAVGRDGIRGLAGRGRGFETETLKQVAISAEAPTVFDAALRCRDFYFGVVPPLPANRDLYTVLGGRLPAMALVLPIQVKNRTAALLYLDDDERPMTHPDISAMRRVTAKAGLAFEILLLRNKLRGI
jgi:hypothetical protein